MELEPTYGQGDCDENATYQDVPDEELQMHKNMFLFHRKKFEKRHGNVYIAIYKNADGDLKYDYDEDFETLFDRIPAKRFFIDRTVSVKQPVSFPQLTLLS